MKEIVVKQYKMIKDYDYQIKLGDSTEQTVVTPKLSCLLDSIIISANKNCELDIVFEENNEVSVFKCFEVCRTRYIPIRNQGVTSKNELLLSAASPMLINNKLKITVHGATKSILNLTLRCVQ